MIYLQLFFSFLQIGMFSFGGGYAAMPLIREQVVSRHGWLDMGEFTNLITISQMTPGPIAINSATFVGTKIAGIPGAVVSTFGCILPSCILVTLLAWLYLKYQKMDLLQSVLQSLRPAVVAMIASAGVSILVSAFWNGADAIALADTRWMMVGIFVICLILLRKTKWNPVLVMALAGVLKLLTAIAGNVRRTGKRRKSERIQAYDDERGGKTREKSTGKRNVADTFQSLSGTSGRIYGWCKRDFPEQLCWKRWKIRGFVI